MFFFKKSQKNIDKSKITVAVAMSGGVDSSTTAAILKKEGYNVLGFFMKNWNNKLIGVKKSDCPQFKDMQVAKQVAEILGIPFEILDFQEEYRDRVLNYFFDAYEKGITPNPDVMCNSQIKFGVFLDKAKELGANLIATGHYARVDQKGGIFHLRKGIDKNKDQSYFLYRLNQDQLSKTLFPVGNFEKPNVRKMAKKFSLPNYAKKDSQGVCFIGHLRLKEFLSQKIKENPGDIVTKDGKKIGKHDGLFWYTPGQRKGIGLGGDGPYYVLRKDFKNNELVITNNKNDKELYSSEAVISQLSWVSGQAPLFNKEYDARIRYREKLTKSKIEDIGKGRLKIMFKDPQWASVSGQSVVFYDKDECVGGGIIENVFY